MTTKAKPSARRVLSEHLVPAAQPATTSQNSPRLPRVSLPRPRLPPPACRSPDSPARKPHPLRRPLEMPPQASPFRRPPLRVCLSTRPRCAPPFFSPRRGSSSSEPNRHREWRERVLQRLFRKESSAPKPGRLPKRKSAAQKNVSHARKQSQRAPAHLRARACESGG